MLLKGSDLKIAVGRDKKSRKNPSKTQSGRNKVPSLVLSEMKL